MNRLLAPAAAVFAVAALLSGCSQDEPIYDVSGTITFEGKPVGKGLIFFDPDKGTPGTQGFANIENGTYNTAGKGKGIRGGGPYSVRINGFDGIEGPDAPFGQALFPEHQFTQELPAQNQTFDYDVKRKRR
jgi:hypothetical protein